MRNASLLKRTYRSPHTLAGLPVNTPVLLAFSGGADSRALLHLLAEDARKNSFSLVLAHVNHGIRGEEALRDREFCIRTAKEYGLDVCVLDADVPALSAKSGRGIEEEARAVRYAYFESLMREKGIPLLVTAHHANDQLETVLFRLSRGCALSGLCGILPVREFANGFLVRPILEASRKDILQFVKDEGLCFVTDCTNEDVSYARNRIRGEIVPVLEALFQNPEERIATMTATLREDNDALGTMAKAFLEDHNGESLLIKELTALHPAIGKRVLYEWINERTGLSIHSAQLLPLWELLEAQRTQGEITLGSGTFAVISGERLHVRMGEAPAAVPFCLPACPGEIKLPDSGIRISIQNEAETTKVHNLSITDTINYRLPSAIIENAWWRPREAGDVILMGGMHRKLRKLYNAKGIPVEMRERIPLLCDREGIILAPLIGVRDGIAGGEDGDLLTVKINLP